MTNKLNQKSGDKSSNLQVNGNINVGITYEDARNIALDVYKSNFLELSHTAAEIATSRAEKITDDLLTKVLEIDKKLMNRFDSPAVQSSLFSIQKEYAYSGDENRKALLIELMAERLKYDERELKQIIYDQAISLIGTLTNAQIDCLSLITSLESVINSPNSIESFVNMISNSIIKFYSPEFTNRLFFSYLRYSKCCEYTGDRSKRISIEKIMLMRYSGIFSKGFTKEEVNQDYDLDFDNISKIIMLCLQDVSRYQIAVLNEDDLMDKIAMHKLHDKTEKLKKLVKNSTMTEREVENFLQNIDPAMNDILRLWNSQNMNTLKLSAVGSVIGLINYNMKTPANFDIDLLFG